MNPKKCHLDVSILLNSLGNAKGSFAESAEMNVIPSVVTVVTPVTMAVVKLQFTFARMAMGCSAVSHKDILEKGFRMPKIKENPPFDEIFSKDVVNLIVDAITFFVDAEFYVCRYT